MDKLAERLFEVSRDVRYVATYADGKLELKERPDLRSASSSESDRYEELLVNPTVSKLLTQRGNIDCGGLLYFVVRYGNFYQFVQPLPHGHVSIGLEPDTDLEDMIPKLRAMIAGGA